jgi:hypothetical protein
MEIQHQQFIKRNNLNYISLAITKFKTAVLLAAVFFSAHSSAQNKSSIQLINNECDWNDQYLQNSIPETLFVQSENNDIVECKIRAPKCRVESVFDENRFYITPHNPGVIKVKAKVEFKNGRREKIKREFISVDLPDLCLELSHSTPDHQFIWLELRNALSNEIVNELYEICLMKFTLRNSKGEQKTTGIVQTEVDFFPSISLKDFNTTFELGDELTIQMIIIHKEYKLIQGVESSTLIIDKLWN